MKYKLALLSIISAVSYTSYAGNWNVPIASRELNNPIPINQQTLAEGKPIYTEHCASCHAEDGKGNGVESKVEYSLQSILHIPSQPGNVPLSDGELYWKITHGIAKMPSFAGVLTDRERWLMVNHIRDLPDDTKTEYDNKMSQN